ncbi:MAG: hypothetical protein ACRC42_01990 [Mycoplasma sp.]
MVLPRIRRCKIYKTVKTIRKEIIVYSLQKQMDSLDAVEIWKKL